MLFCSEKTMDHLGPVSTVSIMYCKCMQCCALTRVGEPCDVLCCSGMKSTIEYIKFIINNMCTEQYQNSVMCCVVPG